MASLSTLYDGSFKGTAFLELYESGLSSQDAETEEEISITHIPGSNRNVLQSSGRLQQTLNLPIATSAANISALRASVGSSGSLVYKGGTKTARLGKVGSVQRVVSVHDITKCVLVFYLS